MAHILWLFRSHYIQKMPLHQDRNYAVGFKCSEIRVRRIDFSEANPGRRNRAHGALQTGNRLDSHGRRETDAHVGPASWCLSEPSLSVQLNLHSEHRSESNRKDSTVKCSKPAPPKSQKTDSFSQLNNQLHGHVKMMEISQKEERFRVTYLRTWIL